METYEMKVPFKRVGNFLFSSGYLIHARTHLESAMAIDLVNKTIHAGIYREAMASRLFSEDKRPAPAVMKKWLRNLQANQ